MDPTWRAVFSVTPEFLVNPDARPAVEGQIAVGSLHILELRTAGEQSACGDPAITWNFTNPEVVRIVDRPAFNTRLLAVAPGHTQISATVVHGGRTSEVGLSWCRPNAAGSQQPRSVCTWIPMSGVRVVP